MSFSVGSPSEVAPSTGFGTEPAVHRHVISVPSKRPVWAQARPLLLCGHGSARETSTVRMTRHVHPNTLFAVSNRSDPCQNGDALAASGSPLTCTDGSLIINADGSVSRATPEQQRIALLARAERALGESAD
jgi:hypothetical protein